MPEYVWVKDTDGLEYAVTRAGLDPEIHQEVKGASVVLDAYGLPQLATEPGAPAQSAPKAEWVQYAVSQGTDPAEAEAATKAELIADHGKES